MNSSRVKRERQYDDHSWHPPSPPYNISHPFKNAPGLYALSPAPIMAIDLHDPLVDIKGIPSFHLRPPFLPPHLFISFSHRIRLWLCRDMHDFVSALDTEGSLLVG